MLLAMCNSPGCDLSFDPPTKSDNCSKLPTLSISELFHARIACKSVLNMERLLASKSSSFPSSWTWSLLRDSALPRIWPVGFLC